MTWVAAALVLAAADVAWQADALWEPTGVSALAPGPLRALAAHAPANLIGGGTAWVSAALALVALARSTARGPVLFLAGLCWALAAGALEGRLGSGLDGLVLLLSLTAAVSTGWRPRRIVAAVDGWSWFALRTPWLVLLHTIVLRALGDDGASVLPRDLLPAAIAAPFVAVGGLGAALWLPWPWLPRRWRVVMAVLLVLATLSWSLAAHGGVLVVAAVAVALAALDDGVSARGEPRAQWTAPDPAARELVPFVQRVLFAAAAAACMAPVLGYGDALRAQGVPTPSVPTQGAGPLALTADGAPVPWRVLGGTGSSGWSLPTAYPRIDAALAEDPACADSGELASRLVAQLASGSAPVAAAMGDLRFATPTSHRLVVRTADGRACAVLGEDAHD